MLSSGSDKPLAGLWFVLVSGSAHLTDEKIASRKQRTIGKFQTDREGALTRRVDSAEYVHFFWIAAGVSCSWTCCVRRQDGMEGHFGGLCCECVATLVRFFSSLFLPSFSDFCFFVFCDVLILLMSLNREERKASARCRWLEPGGEPSRAASFSALQDGGILCV